MEGPIIKTRRAIYNYIIIFLIMAFFTAGIVSRSYRYDPSWAMFVMLVYIGLPIVAVATAVMYVLLRKKIHLRYEILGCIVMCALIVVAISTMVHKNDLPDNLVYSEALTELYNESHFIDSLTPFRVYLGDQVAQGREVLIYRYIQVLDELEIYERGIEKDGKLFINNWRVYPTKYIGISHLGDTGFGQGIFLNNLTIMEETYMIFLKNSTGHLINNSSNYNVGIGEPIAVFGQFEDGPVGLYEYADYLIVDRIEVVEILT